MYSTRIVHLWHSRRKLTYLGKVSNGDSSFVIYNGIIWRELFYWLFLLWTLLHQVVGGHFMYMEQSTNSGSCVIAIGLVLRGWKYHSHFNELRTSTKTLKISLMADFNATWSSSD